LRQETGYRVKKIIDEFPKRNWNLLSLNTLRTKLDLVRHRLFKTFI